MFIKPFLGSLFLRFLALLPSCSPLLGGKRADILMRKRGDAVPTEGLVGRPWGAPAAAAAGGRGSSIPRATSAQQAAGKTPALSTENQRLEPGRCLGGW